MSQHQQWNLQHWILWCFIRKPRTQAHTTHERNGEARSKVQFSDRSSLCWYPDFHFISCGLSPCPQQQEFELGLADKCDYFSRHSISSILPVWDLCEAEEEAKVFEDIYDCYIHKYSHLPLLGLSILAMGAQEEITKDSNPSRCPAFFL